MDLNPYALLIVTDEDDRPEGMTQEEIDAELERQKKCTERLDKAIADFNKELVAISTEYPEAGIFDTMTRDIISEKLMDVDW